MPTNLPLQITDLAHQYGQKTIFNKVNVELKRGECIALIGKSGCGKSTLLRDIAGLATPCSGQIHIDGNLVFSKNKSIPTENRKVGMLFQDYALFPTMNVRQNIGFGLYGKTKSEIANRVDSLLQLTELKNWAHHYPHQLSGGQQQRTALARAIAPKPKLLLLDEPFANIDTRLRTQLSNSIRMALSHEKIAAIMVTHDRNDAFALNLHRKFKK